MKKLKTFNEWLQTHDQDLYDEIWGSNTLGKIGGAIKKSAMPLLAAGAMAMGGQAQAPTQQPLDSHAILQQLQTAMDKGDHKGSLALTKQLNAAIDNELNGLQGKTDSALDSSGKTLDAANKEFYRRLGPGFEPESETDAFIRQTNQPDPEVNDFINKVGGRR